MDWLNYHHLLYFWVVAKEGSIARATQSLRLAQPTISGQIHQLEDVLGEKLFTRRGRQLELTELGRVVYRYADGIFTLGRELQDVLREGAIATPLTLVVGVADVVPKLVARRLLEPATTLADPVRLVCREDRPDRLLADLAVHELDVVLADAPASPSLRVRAFHHLLEECDVTFMGVPSLAARYRPGFPRSLADAPLLLPSDHTALRRSLDQWFTTQDLRPTVVGEFEDSALLKEFGEAGLGLFPVPSIVAEHVQQRYGVLAVGRLEDVRERYYAIMLERRIKHPAVMAIAQAARGRGSGAVGPA